MEVPVSWLREFVDIDIPIELLAERMTVAGLEVGAITYVGVPQGFVKGVKWPKSDHLVWDRDKIVLGAIREVKPHPDADRLVMAMVDYGGTELEQTVTGAPNLFAYKGVGPLDPPLWTPFAKEGAEVWDGHSEEPKRMVLKEKKLRGVPNRCMVCSEKELGLADEHDGILLLENPGDYVPGTPLQDVLGDVILTVELTPNLARCFSILGVAREVAALLDKPLREPSYDVVMEGAGIKGEVSIDIREPELNPRFTLALLRDMEIKPSPQWMQRRLKQVGQRPINNIVDVTNYITFEIGQPLHAYDFDKLKAHGGGKAPKIITRLAQPGETLDTLDEVHRELDPHNILVCDTESILGLGGVIGGADTEISDTTKNVLLEAANWNFINVRRTMQSQKIFTDAGTRFSRGVHPSQALLGVKRGIELMRQTGGGQVAQGIIDEYPLPEPTVKVELHAAEVERILGMSFTAEETADILRRLSFGVELKGDVLQVTAPDYRMDISSDPITGQADLIEEIARIHGYNNIPDTIIADMMPPQWSNTALILEERARDVLVALGLRETISYRLTTPEREALLNPTPQPSPRTQGGGENGNGSVSHAGYVELANPMVADRTALRHSLLINLLENAAANARFTDRQQLFEIGNVYFLRDDDPLPDEPRRLGVLLTGARRAASWINDESGDNADFFDLKGVVEGLLDGLHIEGATYARSTHPSLHPGRSAQLNLNGKKVGDFGELHPLVAEMFELTAAPVLVGEFDLDALLEQVEPNFGTQALPTTPPVLQDIALVVNDETPAAAVEAVIVKAGGNLLKGVRLFDVYRGDPIPAGQKSLAYSLVYQADDRTLTDKEVASVHQKIVKTAERELGAKLRA
ncbi:MAG: phenylalanine--tRNA ligase subunit beta [Anaerolineae bacterium]|nr:phenylalanine--tRNA ligase subunit beta [Anaerolineae bacterium]